MHYLRFLTDFGDQAVILPLAATVALIFLISGWRRGALAWTVAVSATLGVVLLLKLAFLACGHLISDLRRINSHICSIAYPILEEAGVLARTRLKTDETVAAPVVPQADLVPPLGDSGAWQKRKPKTA